MDIQNLKASVAQALGDRNSESKLNLNNYSQSYLRAEVLLTNTGVITWNWLEKGLGNNAAVFGSERRLAQNDMFVPLFFGFRLLKRVSADTTAIANYLGEEVTYVNPTVLAGVNDPNINAMYKGIFRISKDRTEYVPGYPMMQYERIADSQSDATAPATTISGRDGIGNSLWGFAPSDLLVFDGTDNLETRIDLPVVADMSGGFTYLIAEARGLLRTNWVEYKQNKGK